VADPERHGRERHERRRDSTRAALGQLPEGPLPGHSRLERWLRAAPDWDAEFPIELGDLEQLIESRARPPTGGKAP
jgi:hypothetical protein